MPMIFSTSAYQNDHRIYFRDTQTGRTRELLNREIHSKRPRRHVHMYTSNRPGRHPAPPPTPSGLPRSTTPRADGSVQFQTAASVQLKPPGATRPGAEHRVGNPVCDRMPTPMAGCRRASDAGVNFGQQRPVRQWVHDIHYGTSPFEVVLTLSRDVETIAWR
jgi:hypothetical protein